MYQKFIITQDGVLKFGNVYQHSDLLDWGEECPYGGGLWKRDEGREPSCFMAVRLLSVRPISTMWEESIGEASVVLPPRSSTSPDGPMKIAWFRSLPTRLIEQRVAPRTFYPEAALFFCPLTGGYTPIHEVTPKVVAIAVNTVMTMFRIFPQRFLFIVMSYEL